MTRRELLNEQYEDALFALLMDDFAIEQGQAALDENERLKADPFAAVPLLVQRQCIKMISKHFAKQKTRAVRQICYRVINKVSLIALACMLLFTTAFAAFPSFRHNVLNLMIDTFDDRTNLQLIPEKSSEQTSIADNIVVNWLPEGYELISQNHTGRSTRNVYQSQSGNRIQINLVFKEGVIVSIDTEDAEVEACEVQGVTGLLAEKDGSFQISWMDNQAGALWTIFGEGISKADIIQIAENVRIK